MDGFDDATTQAMNADQTDGSTVAGSDVTTMADGDMASDTSDSDSNSTMAATTTGGVDFNAGGDDHGGKHDAGAGMHLSFNIKVFVCDAEHAQLFETKNKRSIEVKCPKKKLCF